MHKHPKKFWVYILPFLAVIPLTIVCVTLANSFATAKRENLLIQIEAALWDGLSSDLRHLDTEGDAVAEMSQLKTNLIEGDTEAILALLLAEKDERDIGLMGLANKDGYIIMRTKSVNSLGDHALSMSPQGRAIAAGSPSVASIEISSFDAHQVFMTTARPVMNNDEQIGTLFANYLLDDVYADDFFNQHFSSISKHTGVAFYTDVYGVYSTNFNNAATDEAMRLYLTPTRIAAIKDDTIITVNGDDYLVHNVPIQGLEGTHTGALIFLPVMNQMQITLIVFLLSLLFALYADHALFGSHSRKEK